MKTIIAFIGPVMRMLETGGYAVEALLQACQSAANDKNVNSKQGDLKRSAMKLKSKGKEIAWTETDKTEYLAPESAPLKFVSWHDAVAALCKNHGDPAGELTPDVVPAPLKLWIDMTFSTEAMKRKAEKKEKKNAEKNNGGNGHASNGRGKAPKQVEAPMPPA